MAFIYVDVSVAGPCTTIPSKFTDDLWIPEISIDSTSLGIGTLPLANFNGVDGEAIANFGTDPGPVQSKNNPFHPTNV